MTSVQDVSHSTISASSPEALSDMTVSSWAHLSSGTPSVSITDYDNETTISWTPPGTRSSPALTAERTGEAPINQHSNIPVLIPLLSVVGAALLFAVSPLAFHQETIPSKQGAHYIVFIIITRVQRRRRALAAHRRRYSWAAAHKYRWDTQPTYRDIEASEGTEAPPAYTLAPYAFAPPTPVPRVMTHDRRGTAF